MPLSINRFNREEGTGLHREDSHSEAVFCARLISQGPTLVNRQYWPLTFAVGDINACC